MAKTLRGYELYGVYILLEEMTTGVEFLDILLWDLLYKLLLYHQHRISHSGKNFFLQEGQRLLIFKLTPQRTLG